MPVSSEGRTEHESEEIGEAERLLRVKEHPEEEASCMVGLGLWIRWRKKKNVDDEAVFGGDGEVLALLEDLGDGGSTAMTAVGLCEERKREREGEGVDDEGQ